MVRKREEIQQMDEAELRTEILIPLFRAMGFKDVQHWHGGSLELGKDIVMWKSEEVRERVNYAVVAKAGKVSGAASGKGSAYEVWFQVQQCFGSSFLDAVTGEPCDVERCFVVTSMPLSKEARGAMETSLSASHLKRLVSFIDGDKLWELVTKFLHVSLIDRLAETQTYLKSIDESFAVIATVDEDKIGLSLRPKPGALPVEPLPVSATFAFPDTPEGQRMREAFETHLRTGAPVTFTQQFITAFAVPEFLSSLGLAAGIPNELTIGPRTRAGPPTRATLQVTTGDGETAELPGFELRVVQVGSEEVTVDNEHQRFPWRLRITVRARESEWPIDFRASYEDVNVRQELIGMRFQNVIAKGGVVSLLDADSGLSIFKATVPPLMMPPIEPRWLRLLESLDYIQRRANVEIRVPRVDVTAEDAARVFSVAEILRTGELPVKPGLASFVTDRQTTERILQQFSKGDTPQFLFEPESEQSLTVLGTSIPLGRCLIEFKRALVTHTERDRLHRELAQDGTRNEFRVKLEPAEGSQVVMRYPQWLPQS